MEEERFALVRGLMSRAEFDFSVEFLANTQECRKQLSSKKKKQRAREDSRSDFDENGQK